MLNGTDGSGSLNDRHTPLGCLTRNDDSCASALDSSVNNNNRGFPSMLFIIDSSPGNNVRVCTFSNLELSATPLLDQHQQVPKDALSKPSNNVEDSRDVNDTAVNEMYRKILLDTEEKRRNSMRENIADSVLPDDDVRLSTTRMQLHNIEISPDGFYLCPQCDYTNRRRYLVVRHMRSHSSVTPYVCEVCSKGFKQESTLKDHLRSHAGEKRYRCSYCMSAFVTYGEISRHIRYKHTFEKPYKCTSCDFASVEMSKLRRHLRTHNSERPFQCSECSYASADNATLKRHMLRHTGLNPFKCSICDAEFRQKYSLDRHMKKGHEISKGCALQKAKKLKEVGQKSEPKRKPKTWKCRYCSSVFSVFKEFLAHVKHCQSLKEKRFTNTNLHDFAKFPIESPSSSSIPSVGDSQPSSSKSQPQSANPGSQNNRTQNWRERQVITVGNFKCSECDLCYAHLHTLKRHRLTAHKRTTSDDCISCKVCGVQFFTAHSLTRHTRMVHGIDKKVRIQKKGHQETTASINNKTYDGANSHKSRLTLKGHYSIVHSEANSPVRSEPNLVADD